MLSYCINPKNKKQENPYKTKNNKNKNETKNKKKNEEKKAKSKAKVDVSVLSEFFVACFLAQERNLEALPTSQRQA